MTQNVELAVEELIRSAEALGRVGQMQSVEYLYSMWLAHNADHPLAYAVLFNYSVVLSDQGKLELARRCLEDVLQRRPDFVPAYVNLGRILERIGDTRGALAQWSWAIERTAAVTGQAISHRTTALNQSARVLEVANLDGAAESLLQQSLDLDPRQREVIQHYVALRQRQCKWPVIVETERVRARNLMEGLSPLSAAALVDDPLFQFAVAGMYNVTDVGNPETVIFDWPATNTRAKPLRIGYLSSDLREHAVGYLLAEVFGLHDRSRVEVFAYYCGPEAQDPLHASFRRSADHWCDIGRMTDDEASKRIASDKIHILVDLNGYTRDARLSVVAMRPAPVLVNWLGFPGTMASPYHHYIIADEWIIPPEHELYYSERVARLPCYQPNNPRRAVAARVPSRDEQGLPSDATVFCCFNGSQKITRATFERWMQILTRVPGSVLWLLDSTEETNLRLREQALGYGVAGERLVFAAKLANPEHLARYGLADLFLDTHPYGAHTTASDALWMGVPVLTWSGRSFASRVCGSLVRAAGLPELVCSSAREFVERAVELGLDRGQLAALRGKLTAQKENCTLFDLPRLVAHLEGLYEEMWQAVERGEQPAPDLSGLATLGELGLRLDPNDSSIQDCGREHEWWWERLLEHQRLRAVALEGRPLALRTAALRREA